MRCFISVEIPESIKDRIARIQDALPDFRGKKTEPKNLHLTLKFLGEINNKKLERIKDNLENVKFSRFTAEIDSLGIFSPKIIRIVWLHVGKCTGLHEKIDSLLEQMFTPESRFMGHLTIARIKNIKNKKEFMERLNEIKIPKMEFEVNEFQLKESILGKKGPDYRTLEVFRLS